jgi:hypothetical protein
MQTFTQKSYTEDLVIYLLFSGSNVGPMLEVVHHVPVPLRINSLEHISDAFDLVNWIESSSLGPGVMLRESREVIWRVVAGGGAGETFCCLENDPPLHGNNRAAEAKPRWGNCGCFDC